MKLLFDELTHRFPAVGWAGLVCSMAMFTGCTSFTPQEPVEAQRAIASPDSLQLVGDLARPWGLKWIEVEGPSLTVGLDGTGSDPAPTEDYKMLLSDMQVRQVDQPQQILASPSTALTIVRGVIPPGAQKGDRIDLEVRAPSGSDTTSLDKGWLMLSRLKEYARVNGRLSSGHVLAFGQGSILIDSLLEGGDDAILRTRGRVLGGGVVTKSRELGLKIRDENLSSRTSSRLGAVINRRFHVYDRGDKKGVANPKKDWFISLVVHPRYRDNLIRYIRVIENIPVRENSADLVQRLNVLQTRLFDPGTSSEAAVQLEAIGDDGVPSLLRGIKNPNAEVRFYSAEALAYMNEPAAVRVLVDSIRMEPAFRSRGFMALRAMDDLSSQDALTGLLSSQSSETRYGAFQALLKLAPDDPTIRGEVLGEEFRLHSVRVEGPSMVHVSKSRRPEIVLFGEDVRLLAPFVSFAGKQVVVRVEMDGRVRVKRIAGDDRDDRHVIVDPIVGDVIQAVVDMGGSYADVVQILSEAKSKGALAGRLEFGAIPEAGRRLTRIARADYSDRDDSSGGIYSSDGAEVPLVEEASFNSPMPSQEFEGASLQLNQARTSPQPVVGSTNLAPVASYHPSFPKPPTVSVDAEIELSDFEPVEKPAPMIHAADEATDSRLVPDGYDVEMPGVHAPALLRAASGVGSGPAVSEADIDFGR